MTRSRTARQLLVFSALLIVTMFLLVPWLTRTLGALPGYLASFAVYWLCFCLPGGLWFIRRENHFRIFSLRVGQNTWMPWAVGLQVCLIALSSWIIAPAHIPAYAVPAALAFGLVNGALEEFFWRGAYLDQGGGDWRFQAAGVGLFTAWHVPLAFAHGIIYPGGAGALVGGALGMGLFWSFLASRTDHIGWPALSHVLTNAAAFIGFFSLNGT